MTEEIAEFFEIYKLVSDNQFGLRFQIMEYFNYALFCGISKAFPFVTHLILFQKLQHYIFGKNSVNLTQPYLMERHQTVRIGGSTAKHWLTTGINSWPNLVFAFITDLPHSFGNTSFIIFADETTLTVTGRTEMEA